MNGQILLKDCKNRLHLSIENGLKYLENQLDCKAWPFSCILYSKTRYDFTENYASRHNGKHEKFTHYWALNLLGEYFSTSTRKRLIELLLPKSFDPLYFFVSHDVIPADVDTTSLGYATLLKFNLVTEWDVLKSARIAFANKKEDGSMKTYINPDVEKLKKVFDAVISVNVLIFAYLLKEEDSLRDTEDFVYDWLISGKWKNGTINYPSGITFLFHLSILIKSNEQVAIRFKAHVLKAVKECELKYPLDFAFAKLTFHNLEENEEIMPELEGALLDMQQPDGSWPADAAWWHWDHVYWGGHGISTIFALAALTSSYNGENCRR